MARTGDGLLQAGIYAQYRTFRDSNLPVAADIPCPLGSLDLVNQYTVKSGSQFASAFEDSET